MKKQIEFFSKYTKINSDTIKKADDGRIYIEGIISTERPDEAGEIMVQKGMSFDYFQKKGAINLEHKPGPENVLGEPIELKSVKYKGVSATFMKGYLYSESPKVKEIMETVNAMKAANSNRTLGFSVEGQVVERDKNNPSIITKSKILNVSLVANPCNADAYMELAKSIYKQMEEEEMEDESMNEENAMDFSDVSEIEEDHDGEMTLSQLLMTKEHVEDLLMMIKPEDDLPEWCQSHITLAADYIHSVYHYLETQKQLKNMHEKVAELNEIAQGYMSKGKYESKVIESSIDIPEMKQEEPIKIHGTPIGEFIEQELHGVLSEEEAKQIIATIIRMYPNKTIEQYKQIFSQLVVEMMQRIRGDE